MKNHISEDLTFDEYFSIKAASNSILGSIRKSPAHCLHYLAHLRAQTEAQAFGQAAHALILGPENFARLYVEAPEVDRRTKDGKLQWISAVESNHGKTLIKPKEWATLMEMGEAIDAHATAPRLLEPLKAELTVLWEDSPTKAACKARLDGWNEELNAIIDLKTTTDASPRAFERQIFALGYHRQAAWYVRGMNECGYAPESFVFIAIEKDPPYSIGLFGMTKEVLAAGDKENLDLLKIYADCERNNFWPGYPDNIREVNLPKWMLEKSDNLEEY